MIDALIESGEPFDKLIHSRNCDRIRDELERKSRRFSMRWTKDDQSEEWVELRVFSQ